MNTLVNAFYGLTDGKDDADFVPVIAGGLRAAITEIEKWEDAAGSLESTVVDLRDRLTALEAENDRLKQQHEAGLVPPLDDQLQPVDDETVRLKNALRDSKIAHDITVGMLRNANAENARLQDGAKEALALVAYFVNHWPAAHPPDAITRQMLDEAWAMIGESNVLPADQ